MADASARFGLPFIMAGQAQKEITHNEALVLIDAVMAPAAESLGSNTPPAAPEIGQCWIPGATPTGAWAGKAHMLSVWTEGGWRFVPPVAGMRVWLKDQQLWATYSGAEWSVGDERANRMLIGGLQVLGARMPAVPAPAGGTVIDAEARAAFDALTARLVEHGLIESEA